MISIWKSYGFSLTTHAMLLGALSTIPMASQQRFASRGQRQVVSLQAVQVESQPVPIDVQITETLMQVETDDHAIEAVEVIEPRLQRFTEVKHRVAELRMRFDRPAPAPPVPSEMSMQPVENVRSQIEAPLPEVAESHQPKRRKKSLAKQSAPPRSQPTVALTGLEDDVAADFSNNPPPQYPTVAIRKQWQGVVLLELHVDASGAVQRVNLMKSSGHTLLDQAAIEAVSKWRGKPATQWGRPVASVERLPVRFRL